MLCRPEGFTLYGKVGVEFLSISEWLCPNMKIRFRLIGARPNLYMNSDNSNVSLGNVDCSLYTRRIGLKNDYHKEKDMPAYTPAVQLVKLYRRLSWVLPDKTSSIKKTFLTRLLFKGLQFQWIQAPHSLDRTLKIHSGINNYQQLDLRLIRILKAGQPIVVFDAADNCRLYIIKIKAMNFQDDIPSIPIDNSKDHFVLVFVTSM